MGRGSNRPSGPALGQKVAILYRIGEPEHPFSEVFGVVQRIEETPDGRVFHVVKRDGTLVTVPESLIVSVKIVP